MISPYEVMLLLFKETSQRDVFTLSEVPSWPVFALKVLTNCKKDLNFHKNLFTLETGGSVVFILISHSSLTWAPGSLCHCKAIADNHSVNLWSNRQWPLIHGKPGGQSLICPLMSQTSFSQKVDIWFVIIQS